MPNIAMELGKISGNLGVTAAYGEQQDLDGVKVLPVAATWSGFGGGSDESGNGGGGGGGFSLPIGAYIRRGSEFRFAPNPVTLVAVLVPFVCVAGRALGYVIKCLKKRR
ncbi:hypothetical protein GCM10010922_03850 [Microbacterium sorbitolivorans]|uniref:Sporulation protein n=1 Tax=Microbacterium sorbitolivorans TaxID=1867410 RepID=A0A367Y8Y5_9MICO|nr:hypothetical protein [Microbacterium sorbitolivorans]RCK61461.1 hypothetical protein DTO57_02115 [Microbacterium sorbitolivorans]GGF31970.1 hypothetical protein GCM10010922_03850 [Microbacterium sorbitolivorans]